MDECVRKYGDVFLVCPSSCFLCGIKTPVRSTEGIQFNTASPQSPP